MLFCSPRLALCAAEECADLDCFTATQQEQTCAFLHVLGTALGQATWTSDDFCAWSGVTCSPSGATLFLGSRGVRGTLPGLNARIDGSQVARLPTGCLEQSCRWRHAPGELGGGLTLLHELVVTGTSIKGFLPVAYATMTSLTDFLVFDSKVSGTLPVAWKSLPRLQHFATQATQVPRLDSGRVG